MYLVQHVLDVVQPSFVVFFLLAMQRLCLRLVVPADAFVYGGAGCCHDPRAFGRRVAVMAAAVGVAFAFG